MLDAKYIKDNLQQVAKKLAVRGYQFDIAEFEAQEQKENIYKKELKIYNHSAILSQKK